KKIKLDHIHIDRTEIQETGEYDLEGLFIRLEYAIDSIGAKRVVLDTIENLFAGLTNQGILRAELRRLFHWLKEKGVTAIVTGEKGEGMLTRHGLEEYVSDCVIVLDHRIINQISTRRLRIVKYRGSIHGTNEYPFLIDEEGITVLPITSLTLDKNVSSERISTGIASLDQMFGGKGFFRGSSILISGSSGTGKTSIASSFANESCRRKEKCLFVAFEESPKQIIRNMRSIGLNLEQHVKKGLLEFHSFRPGLYGLEMHLSRIYKLVKQFKPKTVILDPVTNLVTVGLLTEVNSMLLRLIDHLQNEGITLMLTALNSGATEHIDENVSSLVDAWILVRDIESNGERNRALYIMKSRGMSHSKEVREFVISSTGLNLLEVWRESEGRVLIGKAREAKEKAAIAIGGKNRSSFKTTTKKIKK
ncbi:MAG TPA: circadian clock protein KaiC, partial [Chitinophagaceae bacterium]|nr:circadian clock protein KaiC [Chitinophagaceae bacterium]